MSEHRTARRWSVAALALGAVLTMGTACSEEDKDDVTNDPVDQSSSTPPEEGDNGGERDTGGEIDDN